MKKEKKKQLFKTVRYMFSYIRHVVFFGDIAVILSHLYASFYELHARVIHKNAGYIRCLANPNSFCLH